MGDDREAEVAVVVEDARQSKGLGKLLLSRLAARVAFGGAEVFFCEVLGENRRVLGLVRAVFAEVGYAPSSGAYLIRAPLGSLRSGFGMAGGDG
jgi:acetyltransferase